MVVASDGVQLWCHVALTIHPAPPPLQIDTFERELGWAFMTYKLDAQAEESDPSAIYWSFRLALDKGLIDLLDGAPDACLHKPLSDYVQGDDVWLSAPHDASLFSSFTTASARMLIAAVVLVALGLGAAMIARKRSERNGGGIGGVALSSGGKRGYSAIPMVSLAPKTTPYSVQGVQHATVGV